MVGSVEARQLERGPTVRQAEDGDLGAGARDADDGVDELALHDHPPLQLKAEPDEEVHDLVEVSDGDAHVVEALDGCHADSLLLAASCCRSASGRSRGRGPGSGQPPYSAAISSA